jgi:hypothetical protein
MILVDAGPLIALFNPRDCEHAACREKLRTLGDELVTTTPALTEALHLLSPNGKGARQLRQFIAGEALRIHPWAEKELWRAFELMDQYRDQPMDFADASLVAAAEALGVSRIFTIDRTDFEIYRLRRGHRLQAFEIV